MNLYQILNVRRTATQATIQKAYRKLARKHHPDAGGSQEKFCEITLAYRILSDPVKRAHYDATGAIDEGLANESDDSVKALSSCLEMVVVNSVKQGQSSLACSEVVALMCLAFQDALKGHRQQQMVMDRTLRLLVSAQGRFAPKEKGTENLLEALVHSHLARVNGELAKLKKEVTAIEKALGMLDGYTFTKDDWRQTSPPTLRALLGV